MALSSRAPVRHEVMAVVLEFLGQSLEQGRGTVAPGLPRAVVIWGVVIIPKFSDIGIGHALQHWQNTWKSRTGWLHASSAVPDPHVADNQCPFW